MHHDTPEPSDKSLRALRDRLRVRLAEESAALDRSWRFQAARRMAGVPPGVLAAVVLVACVLAGYAVQRQMARVPVTDASVALDASALPIPTLTPGATARVTVDELCAGRGPSNEEIAPAVRLAVLRDYGMEGLSEADYELDYLITPELGGSSDRRNLWPERYGAHVWNARVKDELEELLPALVCRGAVDLTTAQRDIAADWIAAYKKYFHSDRPVVSQARLVSGR